MVIRGFENSPVLYKEKMLTRYHKSMYFIFNVLNVQQIFTEIYTVYKVQLRILGLEERKSCPRIEKLAKFARTKKSSDLNLQNGCVHWKICW
jgi:hypothetical protein